MKMPWSFLKRRRKPDPLPSEIIEVKEAFDTDNEPAEPRAQPSASRDVEGSPEGVVPTAEFDEDAPPPALAAAIPSSPSATASGSRRGISTIRGVAGKRIAFPTPRSRSFLKAEEQKTPPSESDARSSESPVSDAYALDQEIRQLRRQLAEKLRLQNAQLKDRLQRFDPP